MSQQPFVAEVRLPSHRRAPVRWPPGQLATIRAYDPVASSPTVAEARRASERIGAVRAIRAASPRGGRLKLLLPPERSYSRIETAPPVPAVSRYRRRLMGWGHRTGWAARLFERHPYIAVALAVAMPAVFVGYDTWRLIIGPRTISEAQVLAGFTWGAVAGLVLVGAVAGMLCTHRGYLLQRWKIAGSAMLVWLPLFVWTHPRHGSEVLTSTLQVGAMVFTMITIATLMGGMARHWWRRAREHQH